MITKRNFTTILAAAGLACLAGAAAAQEFPSKPITLIVPWPAGGPTDVTMRAMAEAASKHLGQAIVIENKAGGAGTVGPAAMAATAKPDGYTLAQMPITVYRLPLMQKTTWKADDFSYIIHLVKCVKIRSESILQLLVKHTLNSIYYNLSTSSSRYGHAELKVNVSVKCTRHYFTN